MTEGGTADGLAEGRGGNPGPEQAAPARPLLIIAGPTGSGKSALALSVAEAFDGVIINADSQQVYRELRILTARPDAGDLARAPHRLYGVVPAQASFSVAQWRRLARAEIAGAHAAGRLPIVVGGTGMYLHALEHGLAAVPPVPADIHAEGEALLASAGAAGLHAALARLDPAMAARLAPADRQRMLRAYGVIRATGRSLAAWHAEAAPPADMAGLRLLRLLVLRPRPALRAACDDRFAAMMRAGALDEVAALLACGLDPALPAMKAVGVRPLAAHLAGAMPLATAVAQAQADTRRYLKRQLTWFRHRMLPDLVLETQYSEFLEPRTFPFIRDFLLTLRE